MGALTVSWRDLLLPSLLFAGILLIFWALSASVGWPNAADGWRLAVIIAGIAAILPLVARAMTFLQKNRASIEGPFGLKVNFVNAVQVSETSIGSLTAGTVQQGTFIAESGRGELERAAIEAGAHSELVIDLEDGNAWYRTRLFAVAAMGEILGAPEILVLVGGKGGRPRQVGGYIASRDFVKAVCQKDSRYERLLRRARDYLALLRNSANAGNQIQPPDFAKFLQYQYPFTEAGDSVFMRVIVDQLIDPDPGVLQPTENAPEDGPPWINLADMAQELSPWLIPDIVEMTGTAKQQVAAILGARGDIAVAVRNGTFEGIIRVELAARDVLRQLAERAAG
jgi:hypothetical protein